MLGRLLSGPLSILYIGVGLWGFFLVSQYLYAQVGAVGAFLGLFVFPATYSIVPIYAGIADGYWLPAIVCYSPIALMMLLGLVASIFE
jgi:hypothetical protein